MIGKRKKAVPVQRSPNLARQKQSTFHYSSNRSEAERRTSRNEQNNPEIKGNSKKVSFLRWLNKPLIIIGILALLASIAYLSSLTAKPEVRVTGGQTPIRENTAYASAASELTNNLRSRSKFSLDRQKITADLKNRFPELTSVDVTTPLFSQKAVISLTMAQPELVLRNGNDSFVIDNRGVVLFNSRIDRTAVPVDSLLRINDQSSTVITVGKPALTTQQMRFITEVKRQSEAKKMTIDSAEITAGGGELAVRYANLSYLIKYSLNEDARKSFGTFIATKEYLDKTKVKPAEYIDVRIAERAYVK